jgi:hypothetical protein
VELEFNFIETPIHVFEFNSIQGACKVIQYFHSNGTLFLQNQFFFHQLIVTKVMHNKVKRGQLWARHACEMKNPTFPTHKEEPGPLGCMLNFYLEICFSPFWTEANGRDILPRSFVVVNCDSHLVVRGPKVQFVFFYDVHLLSSITNFARTMGSSQWKQHPFWGKP